MSLIGAGVNVVDESYVPAYKYNGTLIKIVSAYVAESRSIVINVIVMDDEGKLHQHSLGSVTLILEPVDMPEVSKEKLQ